MSSAQIGVFGLGTMGSALALNLAETGMTVAVTNREAPWIDTLLDRAGALSDNLQGHARLADFVAALERPRLILFMIPSGGPLDAALDQIVPMLAPGDTVIDGGNADFHDTRRRAQALRSRDLHFVGLGISGGEEGARHGPSMMVGGSAESWERLRPILQAVAARYRGDPCVDHLGPDGAGHFVKTVHNGIEYSEMQVIAEVYGLMRNGLGLSPPDIGAVFGDWNAGRLHAYLVGITADILKTRDPQTGHPMVDVIKDAAGQKGTGRWTVIEALRMGQSASMIEAAVAARSWSAEKETRQIAEHALGGARQALGISVATLEEAVRAARILGYAQGFRILSAAAAAYDWPLDSARIAEIWRAGCIIRSALLDDIAEAFRGSPPEGELILAPAIAKELALCIPALREVLAAAVGGGHAVPALSAGLAWYDTMRQGQGPAGLVQAQRDYFGRHGFVRLGQEGTHHGPWWHDS